VLIKVSLVVSSVVVVLPSPMINWLPSSNKKLLELIWFWAKPVRVRVWPVIPVCLMVMFKPDVAITKSFALNVESNVRKSADGKCL